MAKRIFRDGRLVPMPKDLAEKTKAKAREKHLANESEEFKAIRKEKEAKIAKEAEEKKAEEDAAKLAFEKEKKDKKAAALKKLAEGKPAKVRVATVVSPVSASLAEAPVAKKPPGRPTGGKKPPKVKPEAPV